MTPTLIVAAITETAKFLSTDQGQRLMKDLLDGAGEAEKAVERVTAAVGKLFHH